MTVAVDTNVLVYSSNESDPAYQPAHELLDRLAQGPEIVYLFWPVLMGYLRIVTHRRLLPAPLTPADAAYNVNRLLVRPQVRAPGEGDGFWSLFRELSEDRVRGDDVSDTHIAALMRQHGVATIYTRDRDFRCYDGITAVDPFA